MSRKLTPLERPRAVSVPLHAAGRSPPPRSLPGVRGVLFDMCNVLYDNTVWRRWVLKVLGRLGLHTHYHSFFRIWDRDYLADVHCGRSTFCEAFRAFLLSAGLSVGQADEVEVACRARRRELQRAARPLPGVIPTLQRLHRSGLALAVVADSEHPAVALREQLQQVAIAHMLSGIVSSIDLGRTMPDAACYRAAIETMNLPAEKVAFVGHDTAQLAGAATLGIRTIAVNHDPDARADIYLARFEQLLDVVESREEGDTPRHEQFEGAYFPGKTA